MQDGDGKEPRRIGDIPREAGRPDVDLDGRTPLWCLLQRCPWRDTQPPRPPFEIEGVDDAQ